MAKMLKFIYKNRDFIVYGGGLFAAFYGAMAIYKDYRYPKVKYEEDPEEAKRTKVYLVTGANSGLIPMSSVNLDIILHGLRPFQALANFALPN